MLSMTSFKNRESTIKFSDNSLLNSKVIKLKSKGEFI